MKGICGKIMEKKLMIKRMGIGIVICAAVVGMLLIGIREDMLVIETALLAGAGVLLLLVKEPAWLIYLQIIYCCINKILISQFGAPDMINYATDLLMVLIFLFAVKQFYERREKTYLLVPLTIAVLFFGLGTLSAVLQNVPFLLLLWSYRNLMRFFLFFFSCAVLLNVNDIKNILKIFSVVFFLNIAVVSVQFWIQGYFQDSLGGLFGTVTGCNGHMNTFLCIYLAYICVRYMAKKTSFRYFILVSAGSLYIAALSELKFLFVEYVLILMLSILLSRFSLRVVLMILGACAGLYVGLQLFNAYFPGWEFSVDQIMDYAGTGGYSTANDLNRLTALQTVTQSFLRTPQKLLFGMGLGSCETSSFFQSAFFAQYGERLHYTYMIHAFTLLETGWTGLILFLGFFVSVGIQGWRFVKRMAPERKIYCLTAVIVAVMCVGQCFYNNALRVENSGYLAFLVLAFPFICRKVQTGGADEG